ncbi:ISLre2 family transposase [Roseburia hominis]
MKLMIKENGVTFKELEKNIYSWICEIGRQFTSEFLERYDRMLMEERDKSRYRHKGTRQTTVKTVYGEVTYNRVVYEVTEEDGTRRFVYLLDEMLELENVGLVSRNMAELLVKGITELSYRACAEKVSEMTGQSISAMGVWNVIQALGEKVCEEEKELVESHKEGRIHGEKEVPVLFEEADGIYISLQGKDWKKEGQNKAEMKVAIAYDGWKKTGKDRYILPEKVVTAGFAKAKEFHAYREAAIAEKYNLDEVSQRILNADGASWIRKVKDKSTCFQLDPFHRNKAVKENIHNGKAVQDIMELLEEEKTEELFHYLETYRNSLWEKREIEDAEKLIQYYENNREGLLPYQSQGLELPEHPEGLEYRNMGTMENHVWSIIARRMKHNHTSWSKRGGNHLAKILAKKCSGKLYEVTEKLRRPVFEEEQVEELYGEILMSAKAPKKDGKGYAYPAMGHMVGLEGRIRGDRKKLLAMAGY